MRYINLVFIQKGPRDIESLSNFAYEKMEKLGIEIKIDQLLSQDQLNENCIDKVSVCIIAFLPNIYDSSKEQRNMYLNQLNNVIGN